MKKIAISLFLLGAVTAVKAEERPIYHNDGLYLGLLGASAYTYDTHANGFSYSKFTHLGNAIIGNAGYQFNEFFATELDAGYYDATASDTQVSKIYQPAVVLKGIVPLMGDFSLYGKVGIAENMYRYDDHQPSYNETRPLVGVGASYSITQTFELTLLAQSTCGHYSNDDNDPTQRGWNGVSIVGAGINFYF